MLALFGVVSRAKLFEGSIVDEVFAFVAEDEAVV